MGVHPLRWTELLQQVGQQIASGQPHTVAYANVHVLNTAAEDSALRDFLESVDICYCDGEGVRWGARLLGERLPERMTGADWIWDLAREAEEKGWKIFWIGGEPGVTEAAARVLVQRHPRLQIVPDHGFHPKEGPENERVIQRINEAHPEIVLVGMGTPVQERWVQANRARIQAPVVWVLGATADFVSGKVSRGPAFLHQNQEWLARLLVDPRRLWRRYLLGNGTFFARVLRQRLGGYNR